MSNEIGENQPGKMGYSMDTELSDREFLAIGMIVALWGSLEHEIFCQTLMSFGDLSCTQLPKEMNNMQFSQVLKLWESRVVSNAVGERRKILEEVCKEIWHYHEFRNAICHGMWDWSGEAPEKITAIRIRKKEIIRTHFTGDDLSSFASVLETMNFQVRYPGGLEEFANARMQQGAYLSRRAVCLMTNNPLLNHLLPPNLRSGDGCS